MKATLSFKLPEEAAEFRSASRAGDMATAIWTFNQELRSIYKHGSDAPFNKVIDQLWALWNEEMGEFLND